MGTSARVAVLGLYNSGSTAVAGVLHRLGVNMGPPFWASSDPAAADNYYEPYDLAWHLRGWWDEPRGIARVPAEVRVRFLRGWAALQESARPGPVGAKHPLLSLCGDDLAAAWGPGVRFVWAWRPLAESVAGLHRRGWFGGAAEPLQRRLWDALHAFEAGRRDVVRLDWARVRADPQAVARELAGLTGVAVPEERVQEAARFIRNEPRPPDA